MSPTVPPTVRWQCTWLSRPDLSFSRNTISINRSAISLLSSAFPVADFRQVLAVLGDVWRMLDQPILKLLPSSLFSGFTELGCNFFEGVTQLLHSHIDT
jgi:hypothetical protein